MTMGIKSVFFGFGRPTHGIQRDQTGALSMVEGEAAVKQGIILLLTTRPGERVMLPEYGSELHRLAFAPNDGATAGLAIHYVRKAICDWERRVDPKSVSVDVADRDTNEGCLNLYITYRLQGTQALEHLHYPYPLNGEIPK